MNVSPDTTLLSEFSRTRSEKAFAELVRRHLGLVHTAALRMTGRPHLAEEISQEVFVVLAKQAGSLVGHPVLAGWLHRTTRNIAIGVVRKESSRRNREQQAAIMNEPSFQDSPWEEIAPHLDAALEELGGSDRDAVLLRYFQNQSAKDMASTLGISPEAAQKRVNRAVEKLRDLLAKRGVTVGAAGLASTISAQAVQAVPAGLAVSVSSSALVAASAVTQAVFLDVLRKMALGTAAAVSITLAVHQTSRVSELREQNQALQRQISISETQPGASFAFASPSDAGLSGDAPAVAEATASGGGGFLIRASIGGPHEPSEFSLFAPAGRGITTGAAEIAGLDEEQRKAVDKILRAAWKRMENDFASRAVETAAASPEVKSYSIPARSDGGSGPRNQLEAELDAAVGPAKREILMAGIRPGDLFGDFGALDFTIDFGKASCSFRMRDPKSDENFGTDSINYESFVERFGQSFETPEPDTYHRFAPTGK